MPVKDTVLNIFREHFKAEPALLACAPGRVNLIGEHTDYNDGFVLPAAIDREVYVAARPRNDLMINLVSVDFKTHVSFDIDHVDDPDLPPWSKYPRGALWWLLEENYSVPGFDAVIGGNIPLGSGLSSSAAVEVVMIELGLMLTGYAVLPQLEKALGGVKVEQQFIGMPCGVMDQMASAMSVRGHALLIDCRSLKTEEVPVPAGASIVIMDTGKRRGLLDSEYALRREQCQSAADLLEVSALRDATLPQLESAKSRLKDMLYRRARHVITENARVLEMVAALRPGKLAEAGQLLRQSHISLRDDYQVSCTELDVISEIANAQPGCYGARMTGAGFGGCAVALVENSAVDAFVQAVVTAYTARTGLKPELYVTQACAGSRVEKL